MKISEFVLWKQNDKGKWVRYNGIFSTDPSTTSYMRGVRLIRNSGWLPYALLAKPGKHEPIDVSADTADVEPLEKMILQNDLLGVKIGQAFTEYVNHIDERKSIRKKRDEVSINISPEEKEKLADRALIQAVEDYKKGLPIPPFLLSKVITYVSLR